MFEPGVAMHSMKFARFAWGDGGGVRAGPIGLLTVACLKVTGAGRIWAVEPLAYRREMALRMGADVALAPAEIDVVRQIYADTGNRGVDCAIDCAAREHTTNWAIRVARNAGRVSSRAFNSAADGAVRSLAHAAQGAGHPQCAPLGSRIGGRAGVAGAPHRVVRPFGDAHAPVERIAEAFAINAQYADAWARW